VIADRHDVRMQQTVVANRYAIDQSPISRAEVNNEQPMLIRSNFSVMTTDI
tara:strand:- start:545 stop:697 length:153 start_codon:yes stop_codon:yes gene_type:complete